MRLYVAWFRENSWAQSVTFANELRFDQSFSVTVTEIIIYIDRLVKNVFSFL